MPFFEYEAINPAHFNAINQLRRDPKRLEEFVEQFSHSTQLVAGVIEAVNPEQAVAELNKKKLVPVRLSLVVRGADGIQQLMYFKRRRDSLMGIRPNELPKVQRTPINYTPIIGIIGVVALLILLYFGLKK